MGCLFATTLIIAMLLAPGVAADPSPGFVAEVQPGTTYEVRSIESMDDEKLLMVSACTFQAYGVGETAFVRFEATALITATVGAAGATAVSCVVSAGTQGSATAAAALSGPAAAATAVLGQINKGTTISVCVWAMSMFTPTGAVWELAEKCELFMVMEGGEEPQPPSITLSAAGRTENGKHVVELTWSGATGSDVDVHRSGSLLTTTANDGSYTDNTGQKGAATYTYTVCNSGTTHCSNTATVTF